MPDRGNIVLTDFDGTQHTFTPGEDLNGVFNFIKRDTNGVPIGETRLSVSTRGTPSNRKVRLKLARPKLVTETINGVSNPKKVWEDYANVEFVHNVATSTAERRELAGMISSMLGDATEQPLLYAVNVDLDRFY